MEMTRFEHIDFCLLIPCYNNFNGLIVSLESVEYPTDHFLILVVDDGSQEEIRLESIQSALKVYKPVAVLRHEKNRGITAALNSGLAWIEEHTDSRYIARLDCGDICARERFVKQVQYMDAHPAIGLTGTWCRIIDKASLLDYSYKAPKTYGQIQKAMYSRNVFMHATVMFKTGMLRKLGYYPTEFEYAEDYAFFWNWMNAGEVAVLDEFLVLCELNKGGISYKNKNKQLFARCKVINAFGKSIALRYAAYLRLLLLFLIPKQITLRLKKWKG
jgi:glycosyltransferase involved in cell wall biosynthesis